jgi:hypothetical protein
MSFSAKSTRRSLEWVLLSLWFGLSVSLPAAQVVLSQLVQSYTGNPVSPVINTVPPGLFTTPVYRNIAGRNQTVQAETVFENMPAVLPLSTISLAFSGQNINALGNYVRLGGTARNLQSCEILMVTWAKAADFPALAAANPAGYVHPISVTLYSVSPANKLVSVASVTKNVLIPWRPLLQSNGQPWPFNGYAFKTIFDFTGNTILPEQVMIMVDYNTETSGFQPLNAYGPWNSLNVAVGAAAPTVGADVDADVVLRVTNSNWFYPNIGWSNINGPVARLRATNAATKTAPTAPGQYQVTATAGPTSTEGTGQGILTINPPTFDTWVQQQFTPEKIASGAAAPDEDADHDGLSNFAEYAMGTLPGIPSVESPLSIDRINSGFTMVRPRFLTGVRYIPEESSDFTTWNPRPLEIISRTERTETMRVMASDAALKSGKFFLRMRFAP